MNKIEAIVERTIINSSSDQIKCEYDNSQLELIGTQESCPEALKKKNFASNSQTEFTTKQLHMNSVTQNSILEDLVQEIKNEPADEANIIYVFDNDLKLQIIQIEPRENANFPSDITLISNDGSNDLKVEFMEENVRMKEDNITSESLQSVKKLDESQDDCAIINKSDYDIITLISNDGSNDLKVEFMEENVRMKEDNITSESLQSVKKLDESQDDCAIINKSDYDIITLISNDGSNDLKVEFMEENVRMEEDNITSENLQSEKKLDESQDIVVPFQISNDAIINKSDCNNKNIIIEGGSSGMNLRSCISNNKSAAVIIEKSPRRKRVSKQRKKKCPKAKHTAEEKRINSDAEPKTFLCSKFSKISNSVITFERLQNTDKRYKCIVCNKTFKALSHLIIHGRTHSGDKPYKCNICDKAFSQLFDLTRHERTHSGDRPFKCTVCDKAFVLRSHLTTHARTHSGDRPFKCLVCEKTFRDASPFNKHKRIHTGDRPYKCTVCDKTFAQKSTLTVHGRTHTGDKPYKCTVCTRAFTYSSALTLHERTHK